MRSNSNQVNNELKVTNQIGHLAAKCGKILGRRLNAEWQTTKRYISFGMKLRQWVAMWLICILLLPLFIAPASAAVVINNNPADVSTMNGGNSEFEPVNPEQPFWNDAATQLKLKAENWFSSV